MSEPGLWRQRDFLKLWTGQTISQIGSAVSTLGIPFAALTLLHATPRQMGFLSGAGGASVLLVGLFAGAWADRVRRRPLLIAADLGRAALLFTIPLAASLHRLVMPQLYAVAVATGILSVVFDAGYQAWLPTLLPPGQLVEGNSKLALSASAAEVAGPGLTGFLVERITAPLAILADALSFLASALSLALIRQPEPPAEHEPNPHILREIADGLRTCAESPVLRALALRTAAAAFSLGLISSLYLILAVRELRLSAALLGAIISVGGVSNLFGASLAPRLLARFGAGRTLIGAALTTGLGGLLFPLAHGSVAVASGFLLASQLFDAAWPVYSITEHCVVQALTPNQYLGRVSSAMNLLFRGLIPAGAIAGGFLAGPLGVRQTMFAGVAGFLLSTAFLVFSPVRQLDKLPS